MTLRQRIAIGGLALTALALASCSTRRPAPPPAPTPVVVAPQVRLLAPAAYVASAASIDLFIVRASEVALERSRNPRTRWLAADFRETHRGLAGQLSFAGRRVNVLPTARLLPREAKRLQAIETRTPFDAVFAEQLLAAHRQSLALHTAFAARGASPTLRPVATNGARVERGHLADLGGR